MAVSDADFAAWLGRDAPRTLLCELKFAYESGGAPAEGTVYLASRHYITAPTDSPPSQPYRDVIRQAPTVERKINVDNLGGMTGVSFGTMKLDNADGELDFMLRLIVDGRDCRFYLGDASWARSDFRPVLWALSDFIAASDENSIDVTLRDLRRLLDRSIAGDPITGASGGSALKPLIFTSGEYAYSVEAVLKDSTALTYYVDQVFGGGNVGNVYDQGLLLSVTGAAFTPLFSGTSATLSANASTDTITDTSPHGLSANDVVLFSANGVDAAFFGSVSPNLQYWVIAAGLTANDFRLSLTRGGPTFDITGTTFSGTLTCYRGRAYTGSFNADGTIQLASAPAGRVTVDVQSIPPNEPASGVGGLLYAIALNYGGVTAAQLDASSFSAAGTYTGSAYSQVARVVGSRENLIDVLDDVARVGQIWYGPDYDGVIRAGRLSLSTLSAQTPTRTLTKAEARSDLKVENQRAIYGTIGIQSAKNSISLSSSELATSITSQATRFAFTSPYRASAVNTAPTGTAYATNWQGFYKTATRKDVAGAFGATAASDVTGAANTILADLQPHMQTITFVGDLRHYNALLGEVALLTYPRFGFSAGQKCRVVGISTDFSAERVTLTLLTKSPANTTSSAYN